MYISFFSSSTRWILSLVAYLTSTAFSFSNTLWIYLGGWFPTVPITYYKGESAQYSISSTLELDLTNHNRPDTDLTNQNTAFIVQATAIGLRTDMWP